MRRSAQQPNPQGGQLLVLFAIFLTGMLLVVGLVVDVGNNWAQQRATQNAADSSAEAGTVVIVQYLAGSTVPPTTGSCPFGTAVTWDLAVCKAVYGNAQAGGVTITSAQYTDYAGDPIAGSAVGSGFPAGAQGVRLYASRSFGTSFARLAGLNTMTVDAQATAVSGASSSYCLPGEVCGILPLTIPYVASNCDGSGKLVPGDSGWPIVGSSQMTAANRATVPICKNKEGDIGGGSAGSVGFIDLTTIIPTANAQQTGSCSGGNGPGDIVNQIQNNCFTNLSFPVWVKTVPGGAGQGGPNNGPQAAINALQGDTVLIPLFDFSCKDQPTGPLKTDCSSYPASTGAGNNTWYHITTFQPFTVDEADLAGNDKKKCEPDKACLKGWFTKALDSPGNLQLGPVTPNSNKLLGVELIK